MSYGDSVNGKPSVIDLVDGTVIADADAPGVAVSELLAAVQPLQLLYDKPSGYADAIEKEGDAETMLFSKNVFVKSWNLKIILFGKAGGAPL
jgi:hypothetical protein